jgi:serine protease Do
MVRKPLRRHARLTAAFLAAVSLSVAAAAASAQAFVPQTIERIKPAIVAVGTFERLRSPAFSFSGTGFVVGDGLTVATNEHVLPRLTNTDKGETLAIAIPGPDNKKGQIRPARKIAADPDSDLALLSIDGPALPALRLADIPDVREGETYLFTGFPIGSVLGLFPVTHRSMVAAISPIAIPVARANHLDPRVVRRLNSSGFAVFQLDAVAYPGNSGSPVYHPETGTVIGVVNSVFVKGSRESAITQPSGITYAIPAQRLKALLERAR